MLKIYHTGSNQQFELHGINEDLELYSKSHDIFMERRITIEDSFYFHEPTLVFYHPLVGYRAIRKDLTKSEIMSLNLEVTPI